MPRPIKWRRVGFVPEVTYFKPTGIPMRALEAISLSIEELEAIRLKDMEGLQQEECAQGMGISRPTFHRVLGSARSKIVDALVNGKAIRIEGGNFQMTRSRFRCGWDGHEWEEPTEEASGKSRLCPKCHRSDVEPVYPHHADAGGQGWRHGRRWGKKIIGDGEITQK
ncbi:MAG: DUF134 domain-containing protein [Chloroflexota bacterium]|nr:DUF134 domain-containing protein [Chloroflexota bacterium]